MIELPAGWTILLDSIAWAIIHLTIAYLCIQLPTSVFYPQGRLFRTRKWENGGSVYEKVFRVKRWKSVLPPGGTVFKGGFSMRRVVSRREEYIERWIRETCRAELTHWLVLLSSGLFFLWNPPEIGIIMVLYALGANTPCIIVQRYNRPRFMAIRRKKIASDAMD